MRPILFASATVALLGVAAPTVAIAAPGDVNAHTFYLDAQQLMKKGMGAMFDKRTKPMVGQLKDAATRVKADNAAATERGAPLYCLTEVQRKKGLGAQKVVDMLGRVPETQRKRSTLVQAWRAALVREYPCG